VVIFARDLRDPNLWGRSLVRGVDFLKERVYAVFEGMLLGSFLSPSMSPRNKREHLLIFTWRCGDVYWGCWEGWRGLGYC